jgi:hypothetical protein
MSVLSMLSDSRSHLHRSEGHRAAEESPAAGTGRGVSASTRRAA